MKNFRKNKRRLFGIFFCSLLLSYAVIGGIEYEKLRREQERITYITVTQARKIQYVLNTLLQKTQMLKMLVVENSGHMDHFEQIAKELLDDPSIQSLQLAPDGIVKYIYPLKGNEKGLVNLFEHPDRMNDAIYAKNTGKLTTSGPLELEQGGFGIVGRLPIYLPENEGGQVFWGFSIVVLSFPEALHPLELNLLEKEGYAYKLYRADPDSGQTQIFSQTSSASLDKPVNIDFGLPNTIWTLSVAPRNGWLHTPAIAIELFFGFLVSILNALLAYLIFSLNTQKIELKKLSVTDALTGLFNRRMLEQTLAERCKAADRPFVLCYMDLNDFKSVNDRFGHASGDLFLKECAGRIASCLRLCDLLFRVGGDEFVAILDDGVEAEPAEARIAQIERLFAEPFSLNGQSIYRSVSIGRASFPENADNGDELLRIADDAMYVKKVKRKDKK